MVTDATVQLSALTGVPKFTFTALQLLLADTTTLAGAVIVGLTLSFTRTACVAVLIFPEPSVTVQVTIVTPNGNTVGALFVTDATEQLSAVTAVPKTTPVAVQPVSVFTVTFAGAVMVGKIESTTVTIAVLVPTLPYKSVTVKVTVLAPKLAQVNALAATDILAIEVLSVDPLLICAAVIVALPVASNCTVMF